MRIGHRFGFRVRGFKPAEVKVLGSNYKRHLLRDLKVASGSFKSEEYLEMKLNSMGIDLDKIQLDRETLLALIRQIK